MSLPFISGCNTKNHPDGLTDLARISPADARFITYVDIEEIRLDNDLSELVLNYEKEFKFISEEGIAVPDVEYFGMVSGPSGVIVIFGGNLYPENITNSLTDKGFRKKEYMGIEYWYTDIGGAARLIHNHMLIGGGENDVKSCIEAVSGNVESLYENKPDFREVIGRLPVGLMYVVFMRFDRRDFPGAVAVGVSYAKFNKDIMIAQGFIKFDNEDFAKNCENELRYKLEKKDHTSSPEIHQHGLFLDFSIETGWDNGVLFW